MNRTIGKDRLSPPLMHAFRSAHAERLYRARKTGDETAPPVASTPRAARVAARAPITEQALRDDVARDLASLVNTISLESALDLTGLEAVRQSILNYGLRDLHARFADQAGNGVLIRDVEETIRRHEPRLVGHSVHVNQIVRVDEPTLTVRLEISADLQCEPINVPVVFIADIDVDNCAIAFRRGS